MILTARQEKILEDAFELLTIAILNDYSDYQMEELYELNDLIHDDTGTQ